MRHIPIANESGSDRVLVSSSILMNISSLLPPHRQWACSGEREDRVNVVVIAADLDRGRSASSKNARQVSIQLFFNIFVDPRLAIFRAKDEMDENAR